MKNFFKNKKILVTGGAGFIGSHLVERLVGLGAKVTVLDNCSRGAKENLSKFIDKISFYKVDLTNQGRSQRYFKNQEIIFNLAALNTGVDYDLGRTEVMFEDNMLLQMMPIKMANLENNESRFIQVSSASVYSRDAMDNQVPTPEEAETNNPEESKLGYALAKKMGENLAVWYNKNTSLKTLRARFINVYGENDNFDEKGHFIPIIIRKFIEAKNKVCVFGSGKQKRSFMHVDDAVSGLLVIAEKGESGQVYNVDSNNEKSVKEVVKLINKHFFNKKLKIEFDISKPEGSKRRMLDSRKLRALGWKPKVSFENGIERTIKNIESRFNK